MNHSNTIDELLTMDLGAWLHCGACGRNRKADLPALASRHGGHLPLSRVALRMRCTTCQARAVSITIVWDGAGGPLGYREAT